MIQLNISKHLTPILVVALFSGLFFVQKINLMASDLGRHLKNGEIILDTKNPITVNLYSYTNSNYPFVNHHWGFGVLAFLGYKAFGFAGLTIFNFVLISLTLVLVLQYRYKQMGLFCTLSGFLIMLPLLTYRTEIRPETFSELFMVLTVILLLSKLKLWTKIMLLFLLQTLWVNIHVFFVFGLLITATYLLTKRRDWILLPAQIVACLLNPLGLRGALYPLQIFNDYGYRIVENQTPFLLLKVIPSPIYYYLLVIGAFFFLIMLLSIKSWTKSPDFLFVGLLALVFLAGSLKMVRLMPYFGLFGLITLSYCFWYLASKYKGVLVHLFSQSVVLALSGGIGTVVILALLYSNLFNPFINFGVGLMPGVEKSAQFFTENKLPGPIFNNYDAGGYLIFYLYPQQKVFVDNRPETYPSDFFTGKYVPMQENEEVWEELSREYSFNTIYFYRRDYTPWAQPFLIRRLNDPDWAPVFVDDYALIMVKRSPQNQNIIDDYELPPATFLISH